MNLKLFFVFILVISFASKSYSQDFSQLDKIPLKEKADFVNAEKKVLECANYIVSAPLDETNKNRDSALNFLLVWMTGTSDYSFDIDASIANIVESTPPLLGIYLACATKIVLEDKSKSVKGKELTDSAISLLLDYCEKPENKVTLNEALKSKINQRKSNKNEVI